MLLRPFSIATSHQGGCLCFLSLSYQVLGQSARGHPSSSCGRRGARCLLGVIMDHTWLCSIGSPRFGASAVGSASSSSKKALFFSAFCLGSFAVAWALPGPLSSYLGAQCLSVHSLVFVHSTYSIATNKYSRNAMNASTSSVSMNVPEYRGKRGFRFYVVCEILMTILIVYWAQQMIWMDKCSKRNSIINFLPSREN